MAAQPFTAMEIFAEWNELISLPIVKLRVCNCITNDADAQTRFRGLFLKLTASVCYASMPRHNDLDLAAPVILDNAIRLFLFGFGLHCCSDCM